MAAPSYTEDLSDITLAESTTDGGTWVAIGGGNITLGAGADFSMQGTNCVDAKISVVNKGPGVPVSTVTPAANTHFFVWLFLATPGLSNTLANQGLCVVLGTDASNFVRFHVEGSNTYGAVGRVGKCYAVRYLNTTSGSVPYRTLTGSPGTTVSFVGGTANISGSVKGSNIGVDAIRHGTGAYITAGDSGTPATFAGFAAENDTVSFRWGILTAVGGTFELQGRFVVGQNNAGTPTAAYFSDSNKFVTLVDTPHSLSDFTQIIVDHASTVFNLTNITVLALGTNNPGRLVFNNASTTSALNSCTFDKIGATTLRAGVTATGCTWRQAQAVTQNGATLTGCLFDQLASGSSVVSDNPSLVTGCSFVSDGSNHAVEATAAGDFGWDGNVCTGYTAASGGNEAFYNNSGGTINLTIASGTSTPSVRNGSGATTNIIQNPITLGFVVTDENNDPISGALCYIDNNDQSPFILNTTTDQYGEASNSNYTGGSVTGSRWRVRKYGYRPFTQLVDVAGSNIVLPVTLIADPQQI